MGRAASGGHDPMICAPGQLPELFAATPVPAGRISDEAAEAIARLLLEAVENEINRPAEQGGVL
jgi:hypothetical protein